LGSTGSRIAFMARLSRLSVRCGQLVALYHESLT